MKDWMKLIPAHELAFYAKAGFAGALPMGRQPALHASGNLRSELHERTPLER